VARIFYGELDEFFDEDFALAHAVRRRMDGAKPSLTVSENQPPSVINRFGGRSTRTDLLEIEHYLASYRRQSAELASWVRQQDPEAQNSQGQKIQPALARLRKLAKSLERDCRALELAIARGDAAGAALLGLQLSSSIGKKRYLRDFANVIVTGSEVRSGARRGSEARAESPARLSYLEDLTNEVQAIQKRAPHLSKRAIAKIVCRKGGAASRRNPETVRKTIAKILG